VNGGVVAERLMVDFSGARLGANFQGPILYAGIVVVQLGAMQGTIIRLLTGSRACTPCIRLSIACAGAWPSLSTELSILGLSSLKHVDRLISV
jgi:hypothetical protein